MPFDLWLLLIGALLLAMALVHPVLQRLPVTPTMVYLLLGVVLSPAGVNVLRVDPAEHHVWLLRAAEVSVIISLFTVGMKLRLSPRSPQLRPALCLASVSMILTVGLIAAAGVFLLDLPLGAAVLLGAVLAPTDPVLASDVQMRDPSDQDKIRLTLSAEAGLNDGTAFPFVMLGLGLLGYHELGTQGWRWWTIDVAWAITGGLIIGGLLGTGFGRLLLWLQARRSRPLELGEYLVLGLIGVSYGAAIQLHAYGFLSVFAAGLALRAVERRASPGDSAEVDKQITRAAAGPPDPQLASNPVTAPAYFAGVLLATNEQLEHILEVALVLIVGAALATVGFPGEALWFAPLLFFVIRPLAALPARATMSFSPLEFASVAWFGIRGIGSLYYLMYAIDQGFGGETAARLVALTLAVMALSIVVHGISVTPLFLLRTRRAAAD
jgi:NhaP-type Na+/H+ or K+/H+ antiporter